MMKFKSAIMLALLMITGVVFGQNYEDVVAKFNEGADQINKGDYPTAISHLQEVIAMSETVGTEADELKVKAKEQIPLLNYQVAIGYIKKKDYNNAIPYLEKTVDLATAYETNAEYKAKAMKYLPQLLFGVGNQKFKAKKYDEAIEIFNKAIKYSPNYSKAYLGIGLSYKGKYDEDKMISFLTKAIDLATAKNDTKTINAARQGLAAYFVEMGKMEMEDMDPAAEDFGLAVDAFERAVEFQAENPEANYQLAMIYNHLVEYDKAIEYGMKALKAETVEIKIAAINYELGNAYNGNAQYDLACEAFNNAMVGVFEEKAIAKKGKVPGCN